MDASVPSAVTKHVYARPWLACLVALLGAPLLAGETVASALGRIERSMARVHSVSADFVQEKSLAMLKNKLTMHGKVYVATGKFAWHVDTPIRFRMVIDGETMHQWDSESDKIQSLDMGKHPAFAMASNQMRRWFDGNYASFQNEYQIKLSDKPPLQLTFTPKPKTPAEAFLERVVVAFLPDEQYIDNIQIVEIGGDQTLIQFTNTRLNSPIPEGAWQTKP